MFFDLQKTNKLMDDIVLDNLLAAYNYDVDAVIANEALTTPDKNALLSYKRNNYGDFVETNPELHNIDMTLHEVAKYDVQHLKKWITKFVANSIEDIAKDESGMYDYEKQSKFEKFFSKKPEMQQYHMPEIKVYNNPSDSSNVSISNIDEELVYHLNRFIDYISGSFNCRKNIGDDTIMTYVFIWGMFKNGQKFKVLRDIHGIGGTLKSGENVVFVKYKNGEKGFEDNPASHKTIALFKTANKIVGVPYGRSISTYFDVKASSNNHLTSSTKIQRRWKAILADNNESTENYGKNFSINAEKPWWDSLIYDFSHFDSTEGAYSKIKRERAERAESKRKSDEEEIEEQKRKYKAGEDNYLELLQFGDHRREYAGAYAENAPEGQNLKTAEERKQFRNWVRQQLQHKRDLKQQTRSAKRQAVLQKEQDELNKILKEFESQYRNF